MSKEATEHYEAALKEAFPSGATGDVFHHWNEARKALAEQPAPMIRGDIRDGLVDDEPAQQEPVAITTGMALAFHRALTDGPINDAEAKEIKIGLEAAFAHLTTPQAQRKPLTLGQKQRLWSSVGDKPTLKDRVNAYGTAIEAAHGIKEQP